MAPTRQQRRQRQRELTRAGETVLKRGVPARPRFFDLAGLTFLLAQALRAPSGRFPVAACAELAHRAFEVSLRADPPARPLACSKGCAYCCHAAVALTAPEAFLLAREVRGAAGMQGGAVDAFVARAAATAGLTARERFGRKLPCVLLVDGQCSNYSARPLACRRTASFAVEPCIEEFEGQDGEMLVPQAPVTHATSAQVALLAALHALGRPAKLYELSAAVRAVLLADNAEARWLAGEDIFAGLTAEEETAPELAQSIARLAAEIVSLDPGLAGEGGGRA